MMGIDRLPIGLRLGLYALATAALLYLCLAPSNGLPGIKLWDKAEHAISWAVLAGAGLVLFPRRPGVIVLYAAAVGALVEVLQGLPAVNRDSDWRDWVADMVGVAAAWAILRLARRLRR